MGKIIDKAKKDNTSDVCMEINSSIFHSSHTPMLIIDSKNGAIRDANPAASNYYGYTIEALRGLNISDINILSKEEIAEQMRNANKARTMYFAFKHRLYSGEIREVEVYSGPISIKGESLLLSIVHDTQYKKEMEQKINIQESYFQSLFEHSPDAIAILDIEFRIININKSFERIFQYTIDEIKYRNVTEVMCDERMYNESTYFKDSVTRGEFVRKETQRKRKDGKLVDISFLGYPIMYNGEQIGVYAVYTDITENKLYEEELKKAKFKAEEASKFKTQFIANVAHEIRTPMNGIVGIIDLLDDNLLTSEHKEYFNMLRYSVERLSSIISDVMDIAKIEAGKLSIRKAGFNLKRLLHDVGTYFKIQAKKKNLQLILKTDAAIPDYLLGDADKLNQILFNLLSNAIKFTEQGFIGLEVVASNEDEEYIDIHFSVNDTGIGIPEDKVNSLFEDFSQLDSASTKKYGGVGLGLAITKRLIELMDGNIEVITEYGKGSTFSFNLKYKIVESKKNMLSNHENKTVSDKLSKAKILVIEDESINQHIIKSLLRKKYCNVTIANNGKDALEILKTQFFDIILMDIFMPEIDGLELTGMIRRKEKTMGIYTPIIAITAAIMNETNKMYDHTEIDGYIAKPFRKEQLYSVIEHALQKRNKNMVYDLKPILGILDGDHMLLRELANEISGSQYEEEFLGKIEKYIVHKDLENLAKQVHKFKGSISHFQIEAINHILNEIKDSCERKDFNSLYRLLSQLKDEYLELKKFLTEYLHE
ncbi:MAG TPA: PAS domain S-box protein [Patescibacteria group bacterium]|nr:PAS domain S-box protein [Patescibacteria group bacterium]